MVHETVHHLVPAVDTAVDGCFFLSPAMSYVPRECGVSDGGVHSIRRSGSGGELGELSPRKVVLPRHPENHVGGWHD